MLFNTHPHPFTFGHRKMQHCQQISRRLVRKTVIPWMKSVAHDLEVLFFTGQGDVWIEDPVPTVYTTVGASCLGG